MSIRRARLTRQDWIEGGVSMIADLGFDGLAVEPLARRVGATKGSFYWHFTDLAALMDALLEHWRVTQTEQVVTEIDELPAADRLAALLSHSTIPESDAATLAFTAAASHPKVGPVVAEVQELRIAYLMRLFEDRGLATRQAKARARISYAAYLGNLLMSTTSSGAHQERAMAGFRSELMHMLDA